MAGKLTRHAVLIACWAMAGGALAQAASAAGICGLLEYKAGCSYPTICCPDDYCCKPQPCMACTCCCCPDDYCCKPMPSCFPWICGHCPDNYCCKPFPRFCWPLTPVHYSCGTSNCRKCMSLQQPQGVSLPDEGGGEAQDAESRD